MRLSLVGVVLLAAAVLRGEVLTPAWVEVGDGGQAIARIVVSGPQDCPTIQVDGTARPMQLRQPMPERLRPACEFAIPSTAKTASINGQTLALPGENPSRIVVIGDTGCRIKGEQLQACNDPAQWPFARVATGAATERPNLVIHVGDYLYRETPCPAQAQALCGGTPNGDNWESWDADFFTPAAKLLAAAPWAFSRGNHEDCKRSWRGWFYYLDPRPWDGTCEAYSAPYLVKLGAFELVMLDSASVAEKLNPEQAAIYATQLAPLHPERAWLADHHPFWGVRAAGAAEQPVVMSPTLEAAWEKASPKGIDLILSGHVHLFELLRFDHGRPAQLVAGDGGTKLAGPVQGPIQGVLVGGDSVVEGQTQRQFGYTLMTRTGSKWGLVLKTATGEQVLGCADILNISAPKCFTDISSK